jgi:protein-disulfide isomerase
MGVGNSVKKEQQKRSAKTRAMFWALIVVGISGTLFGLSATAGQKSSNLAQNVGGEVFVDKISAYDWVKGNRAAPVMLVEYSDFQCPACGAYYPVVKRVHEEYGDSIAIVYRNFPLTSIHKNALRGAYAAESAGEQGKFWEMHDMLFEKQTEWSESADPQKFLNEYAVALGLDSERFKKDMDSQKIKDKVFADAASAEKFEVNGTPTFFLNGKKLASPRGFDDFKSIIDEALGAVGK